MDSVANLWTAGGVLLGFMVTSFLWRISQEVAVANRNDISWVPPADYVNLAGMVVVVMGVFLAPLLSIGGGRAPAFALGLGAILFVGHCFALAGHYELYNNKSKRTYRYFPFQEKVAIIVVALAVAGYCGASLVT